MWWAGFPKSTNNVQFCGAFFCFFCAYWIARSLKVGVFVTIVGLHHEPEAKLLTLVFLIPMLVVYQTLIGRTVPSKLVTAIFGFFALMFAFLGTLLQHPVIGVANTEASPSRLLGWAVYSITESFSIGAAMLWSLVALMVEKEDAPHIYPALVLMSQLGAFMGSMIAHRTEMIGFSALYLLVAILIITSMFSVMSVVRGVHDAIKVESIGVFSGLTLIAASKYTIYLSIISTFSEIVATIMDYQMKVLAREQYASGEELSGFMGLYGLTANGLSACVALLGPWVLRRFGVQMCLQVFPLCCLGLLVLILVFQDLWMYFAGMVIIKALGYSLNNPSKEILYLYTSTEVKLNAKGWIDTFGIRGGKGTGAMVNRMLKSIPNGTALYSPVASGVIVVVWFAVARRLGDEYAERTFKDEHALEIDLVELGSVENGDGCAEGSQVPCPAASHFPAAV